MTHPYIDADVLIRFLTGDDPAKQAEADVLLQKVAEGELTVAAPDTVIADAVYVLSSPRLYKLPRTQIRALLSPLVRLRHFRVDNRRQILRALDLYASTNLDFGDALIVASMEQARSTTLYSYGADFDQVSSVHRLTRDRPPSDRR